MDMDVLKENVKTAIKLMPPELQLDAGKIFHVIVAHMPQIEKLGPQIAPLLMNDLNALAGEFVMGTLDRKALDNTLREAFGECGIIIPSNG